MRIERLLNNVINFIPNPLPTAEKEASIKGPLASSRFSADDMARSPNYLSFYLGEHHAVAGATGTGKTYYALNGLLPYMHNLYPHVKRYVLDSTSDPDILSLIP